MIICVIAITPYFSIHASLLLHLYIHRTRAHQSNASLSLSCVCAYKHIDIERESERETERERERGRGLAGLKSVAVKVVGGSKRRKLNENRLKVKDKLMDWWHKMIFPVRRVWLAVSVRVKSRKNGDGLLKLHDDVQTCGYEDVQVMWEMLRRSESELVQNNQKRKQQSFWRVFAWSNHNEASALSANDA